MEGTRSWSRLIRRVLIAPWLIEDTRSQLDAVQDRLDDLESKIESAARAQLESLVLLTRAIEQWSERFETDEAEVTKSR